MADHFVEKLNRGVKYLREGGLYLFLLRLGVAFFFFKNQSSAKIRFAIRKARARGEYLELRPHGFSMLANREDLGLSKDLSLYPVREPFSTNYMKEFIGIHDIVIDIGANVGYYVLLEAQLAAKGKIYAIEPIKTNVDLLRANIAQNDLKNIEIFELALSERSGIGRMYNYDRHNLCSFNRNIQAPVTGVVDVAMMTLDEFVKTYVDQAPTFIRMDVEGHEFEIIKGAAELLSKEGPLKLFIEIHGEYLSQEKLDELVGTLKQRKFKVRAIFSEPPSFNIPNANMISKLENKSGRIGYGFISSSYDDLQTRASKGALCHAFFEKT
jgi:FkbM family methyltransferase